VSTSRFAYKALNIQYTHSSISGYTHSYPHINNILRIC